MAVSRYDLNPAGANTAPYEFWGTLYEAAIAVSYDNLRKTRNLSTPVSAATFYGLSASPPSLSDYYLNWYNEPPYTEKTVTIMANVAWKLTLTHSTGSSFFVNSVSPNVILKSGGGTYGQIYGGSGSFTIDRNSNNEYSEGTLTVTYATAGGQSSVNISLVCSPYE